MRKILSAARFQRWCQTIALVFINGNFSTLKTFGIYQGSLKSVCLPVLNCHSCPLALFACPVGALQYFIMTGRISTYVLRIHVLEWGGPLARDGEGA